MKLGLMDFFDHLKTSDNSRCITEGEAVLNAGHLILCGRMNSDLENLKMYALCLQTSALSSEPHQIDGNFIIQDERVLIGTFHCSCKAGNSGKCKHISAVLIYCTRENVEELELISQTDVKCVWDTQKHSTREKYKAVPLKEMPCMSTKYIDIPDVADEDALRNEYSKFLPNSSFVLHRAGRRKVVPTDMIAKETFLYPDNLLNHASQSILMLELSTIPINFANDCCIENYKSKFIENDCNNFIELKQSSSVWAKERKYRVTGSRVYELFTYSKDNWEMKAGKYFWPKKITNKYIRHGIKFEKEARDHCARTFNLSVGEYGLVVPNSNPWLGFSPDGVIFENNIPVALLEIKCIFSGATKTIKEAIKSVTFLEFIEDTVSLKRKHKYYGQIQMGMAVLNLNICYFVVYASYDKTFICIPVQFDESFSRQMLCEVKHKFFSFMWHYACKDN